MKYDNMELREFLYICLNDQNVTHFDMYEYIKSTTNFDKKSLELFLKEIVVYANQNISIEYYKEWENRYGDHKDEFVTTTLFSFLVHCENDLTVLRTNEEPYTKKEIEKIETIQYIFESGISLSNKLSAFHKVFSYKYQIERNAFNLVSLEEMVTEEIDKIISETLLKPEKIKLPKQPLNFSGLFKPEFQSRLDVLFERLQLKGLTDENNNWIINNSINEPAKLYYYLKDNKVLKDIKFAPAIKCFYNEFGCEVVGKANGNPRSCTRINLLIECDEVTEKMYNLFLLSLINQK